MVFVNCGKGDQSLEKGILGCRVAVEVGGKVVRGTVKSLAGSTRAGVGIYLVTLDRPAKVMPFTRDCFTVEPGLGDWGLVRDD